MGMQLSSGIGLGWMKWVHAATLLLLIIAVLTPTVEAAEGKRVAFVVGIGTYDNLSPDKQLKNPVNDAAGVSAKLTEIGFQVTKAPNLTRSGFNEKWQNVLDSLEKGDTFVLFFSGHGVQIDGHNYLLARDIPFIQFGRQAQLTKEAISLDELLLDLTTGDRPHPKNSLVILDACRDNPLIPPEHKSTSITRGLAGLPDPDGIFVIYAVASNRTALDRLSPSDTATYSIFTRTLLPLMGRNDLSIQELSYELKDQVLTLSESVGHEQRPTYYDGLRGRFCLPGCASKTEALNEKFMTTVHPNFQNAITGKDGAPMVLIPAGEFMMGSQQDDKDADNDERPAHPVFLNAYYIDQYEVTTSRYARFFQETHRAAPRYWSEQVLKQHGKKPVVED